MSNARQNITFEVFDAVWQKTNNVDIDQVVNNSQELREMVLQLAAKLVEEAPRHRDNVSKEQLQQPAQQRQQYTYINPAHTQNVYNRLNPQARPQPTEQQRPQQQQ